MDFITHIDIAKLRNIPPCTIELNKNNRQHLIITGPNGCGKTTFINALNESLHIRTAYASDFSKIAAQNEYNSFHEIEENYQTLGSTYHVESEHRLIEKTCETLNVSCDLSLNGAFYVARELGYFILYTSEAHRKGDFKSPTGPNRLPKRTNGNEFVQLLVNLRTQQAYLYEDMQKVIEPFEKEKLEKQYSESVQWFKNMTNALAELLGTDRFILNFDRANFNYSIKEDGKEPYTFAQLSDGYSAILKVVTDLMLAMSTGSALAYTMPGIAIIDEIETHLHVELQRKILPFLVKFFPNIQFIVTTHSPFILSSIDNAVVFDMKTRQSINDLSKYSYSNLIEGYFNTSRYSTVSLEELNRACRLLESGKIEGVDRDFIINFDKRINETSKFAPLELKTAWMQVKLEYFKIYNDLCK